MAAPNIYQNGPGGTIGDDVVTGALLWVANGGFVWYVGSTVSGAADAAANVGALDGGRRREKPLLTLAQAITNCADGDLIVCLENHAESLSAAVTINKKVTIAGEGTGSTRPRFTCTGAVNMFDITVANVRLRNLYFPASTAVATARVRIATAGCQIVGCYFESGASDTNRAVHFITGASHGRVSGTSFVATAATPAVGLEVVNAMTGLDMEDVTFDGGSFGFSSYAFQGTAAVTNIFWNGVDFLNHADYHLATGTTGFGVPRTASGSSVGRIDS